MRVTTITHSLSPEELKGEIMTILFTARAGNQMGVEISFLRDFLDRGSTAPVRVLASSEEIEQAIVGLVATGIVKSERRVLSLP